MSFARILWLLTRGAASLAPFTVNAGETAKLDPAQARIYAQYRRYLDAALGPEVTGQLSKPFVRTSMVALSSDLLGDTPLQLFETKDFTRATVDGPVVLLDRAVLALREGEPWALDQRYHRLNDSGTGQAREDVRLCSLAVTAAERRYRETFKLGVPVPDPAALSELAREVTAARATGCVSLVPAIRAALVPGGGAKRLRSLAALLARAFSGEGGGALEWVESKSELPSLPTWRFQGTDGKATPAPPPLHAVAVEPAPGGGHVFGLALLGKRTLVELDLQLSPDRFLLQLWTVGFRQPTGP